MKTIWIAGLLRQAPVEPSEHLSMYSALRTATIAGGQLRTLRLVGNQLYRVSLRDRMTSVTSALTLNHRSSIQAENVLRV
jgi:hypothetical protein